MVLDLALFDLFSKSSATVNPYEESSKVIIAGLQWAPIKNLKLASNVQILIPAGDAPKPTTKILISGQYGF